MNDFSEVLKTIRNCLESVYIDTKNASPHQSQFVSKISDTLQHILETSSSCRSGRPGGPEIGRDTLSININRFQAIPDRFKHFWKIVHFRSFWSFWWLGARYDLDFRSRANLSLILTHCNSNQSNSVLSTAKKRQSPPVPICLQNLRHSPGIFGDILWLSFWTSRSSRNCPGLTYHSY